jgi:hypothetical protein
MNSSRWDVAMEGSIYVPYLRRTAASRLRMT